MNYITSIALFTFAIVALTSAAENPDANENETQIIALVAEYSLARETNDPELLKSILTKEIDQLVSSGTWRRGIKTALAGMMRSSASRPGSRMLTVEQVRFLNSTSGIVDARYEVTNADGSMRKMWSTFIVTHEDGRWKIAAIRNMLPAQ